VESETTVNPKQVIADAIETLLKRRGAAGLTVTPQSKLTADLGMDSLELAELSAILEDELGHDPYSEGIVPETVAELVGYYES
jgi:acyl carrier protein